MNNQIYLVSSDVFTGQGLKSYLEEEGFTVKCFANCNALFATLKHKKCSLAIIDITNSGNESVASCVKIKSIFEMPIISLIKGDSDDDYVSCIMSGLDACVTKPVSPARLTAHVKVLLKKHKQTILLPVKKECKKMTYMDITIYPDKRTAYCNGNELELTNTEFGLLKLMFEDASRAVSRSELMAKVWRKENSEGVRATDDTVKRLRKKLADTGSQASIDNVWGYGFKLGIRDDDVDFAY